MNLKSNKKPAIAKMRKTSQKESPINGSERAQQSVRTTWDHHVAEFGSHVFKFGAQLYQHKERWSD